MKKAEFETTIKEELSHIDTDIKNTPQKRLRYCYNVKRRGRMDLSKEVVLKACIDAIKKQDPKFEPKFDKDFFKLEESK